MPLALLFLYSAADSAVFDNLRALSSLILAVGHLAVVAVGMTFVVWLAVSFYQKKPLVFGGIVLGSVLLVCRSMVGVKFF